MAEERLSPAERRRRATRARIREVAIELFRAKGYQATSVAEIADAADISERTLFRYFSGKRDILFERPESYIAPARRFIAALDPGVSDWRAVHLALEDVSNYMEDSREDARIAWKLMLSAPELFARYSVMEYRWSRGLAQALAARRGDEEPAYGDWAVARAAIAVFGIAAAHWLRDADKPMPQVAADAFREFESTVLEATATHLDGP